MNLIDRHTYSQVLGCLMKNPLLLVEYDLSAYDFLTKPERIIFISIVNLFKNGSKTITPIEIDQDIQRYEASAIVYKKEDGLTILKNAFEISQENNFKYYYNRIKKLSLLQKLKKGQYDISPFYKENFDSLKEENETILRFDESSIEDILNYVEGKYNKIKKDFLGGKKEDVCAAAGAEELIEELRRYPEIGVPLEGEFYNTAFQGARLGKYYLRSASSGTGKTRMAVFDACKIAYPVRWSFKKQCFIKEVDIEGKTRPGRKTLVITTELGKDEIQTMIVAYLSGVNEGHILLNQYLEGEWDRVTFALQIMKDYQDYFFIDEITDPNLTNVQTTIRKYATVDNVKYVFYDYIFSSPSLLNQFKEARIREDVALGMLSTQLKELAKEYYIFICSSTQVNAQAMDSEGFKDETCLRGSKAILDKTDGASVAVKVNEKDFNSLAMTLKGNGKAPAFKMPTHRFDIYKMRRGQYKNVSIWSYIDLGTGEREDLYITTASGKLIENFSFLKDETYEEERYD